MAALTLDAVLREADSLLEVNCPGGAAGPPPASGGGGAGGERGAGDHPVCLPLLDLPARGAGVLGGLRPAGAAAPRDLAVQGNTACRGAGQRMTGENWGQVFGL